MRHLQGFNLQKLRTKNLLTTLNIIRENVRIARVDIGKISGFSSTTCTNTTKVLIEYGFIEEKAVSVSTGGRKPILLELNYNKGYVIGVSIERKKIQAVLYNLNLDKLDETVYNLSPKKESLSQLLKMILRSLLESNQIPQSSVFGITLCVPGIVDPERHKIIASSSLSSISDIELYDELQQEFDIPLHIVNNATLIALAEKELFYKNYGSLVYLLVGEGVGAGIILDNKIITGAFNCAGEIGHTIIDKNGPLCFCGNRGCLETMASIPAVLQRGKNGLALGHDTILKDLVGNDPHSLTLDHIKKASEDGDTFANYLINDEIENLYCGVVSVLSMFDPEIILIGGGIQVLGNSIIDGIKNMLEETIFRVYKDKMEFAFSSLEKDGEVIGAGIFALNEFFTNEDTFSQVLDKQNEKVLPADGVIV